MIHKIEIDDTVTFDTLAKEFRKKLMTGGAVVRLRDGLTPEQRERIRTEFEPHCKKFGIADEVMRELAKLPS